MRRVVMQNFPRVMQNRLHVSFRGAKLAASERSGEDLCAMARLVRDESAFPLSIYENQIPCFLRHNN